MRILKLYAQYYKITDIAKKVTAGLESSSGTLRAFLDGLASSADPSGRVLLAALKNFKPRLLVNKVRSEKDGLLGRSIVDVVRKYFLIEIELLGTIPYDERVHWSLKKFTPFVLEYPQSTVSETIKAIAQKLAPQQAPGADKNSSPLLV